MKTATSGERLTAAEKLLKELGVTEPHEIHLDAIAYYKGVTVDYRPIRAG